MIGLAWQYAFLMAFTLTQPYPCCTLLLGKVTCLLLYFTAYYFYYAYIYHIDAWWKLELSGLWGECCVCDLGAWRVRVVSTKLEYMTSLGASLAAGCYLGTPRNGYLRWVNGI